MQRYNKFWAALIMTFGYVLLNHFGAIPPGFDRLVVDAVAAAVTSFTVYQVPNRG